MADEAHGNVAATTVGEEGQGTAGAPAGQTYVSYLQQGAAAFAGMQLMGGGGAQAAVLPQQQQQQPPAWQQPWEPIPPELLLQHFAATQATGWWPGGLAPMVSPGRPQATETEDAAEQLINQDSPGPPTDLSPSPVQ
jgi:hypothetical protein